MEKSNQLTFGLVALLVVGAFVIGSLYTKVKVLEKNATQPTTTTQTQQTVPQQPQPPTVTRDKIQALFNKDNITFGDKNSKNLLVEIADPSCPYCHVAGGHNPELSKQINPAQFTYATEGGTYIPPVPEMKKLVDSDKAAFVWIYTRGHGNGEMGTKALYCAYEKGKFWQIHDKLMSNAGYNLLNTVVLNDKTKSGDLANFLSDVFDQSSMKACLDSGKYDTKITQDMQVATSLGVQGTPGFFINTQNFAGAYSWKDMSSAVVN